LIVPFRAFQFLLTPEDQLGALAGFRRHLRAGGILARCIFLILISAFWSPERRARSNARSAPTATPARIEAVQ
jgi:hypothetical protein